MKLIYNEQQQQCLLGAEEAEMGKEVRLQNRQEESSGALGTFTKLTCERVSEM